MKKSPAFRFYPSDFWGSPDVQAMELHEVGAYVSLLSNAWLGERPGYLADDDDRLRRWARMTPEQWSKSRAVLLAKIPVAEEGWRANPRLALEAEKQHAFSESQSAKGKLGGRPPKAEEKPQLSNKKPGLYQNESPEKPSVSVSASVSVSDTASGSANTLALTAGAVPAEVPLIVLPLVKGTHLVTKAEVELWADAYPAVDVMAELRKLLAWLDANPSKKNAKVTGSKKRITNWLSNAQDRGGRNGGNRGNGACGPSAGANGKTGGNLDAGSRVLAAIGHRQGVAHAG